MSARTDIAKVDSASWAQLLLRGSNYTCTGERLPLIKSSKRALDEYQTIVQTDAGGEGRHLVWLIVSHQKKLASGPLALVERRGDALIARAVGTLTLPDGKIALRYNYGDYRQSVWAESRTCRKSATLARMLCDEQVAVFEVAQRTLVPLALPITTRREKVTEIGGGWHRVVQERCEINEQVDRLTLAKVIDEHEVQAYRRNAQPRRRRSETQHFEVVFEP